MLRKLEIIKFWCIAFAIIIFNTLKNKHWNMIYADFEMGTEKNGRAIRKQLIAKRRFGGFDIYWQDLSKLSYDRKDIR